MQKIAIVLGILAPAIVAQRSEAASPLVTVEAILVQPQSPPPDALCKLGVKLKNAGSQTASYFRFKVKIDGQDVAIYKDQLYVVNVEPKTSGTIDLYSFWTPAGNKASFSIEVTLVEAQWVEVKRQGDTVTTTAVGPVEGLPVSATETVRMSASK